jgi:uncharacterized protein with PQ loop repeat
MTLAECSLAAFILLNGARAIAYLPQIIRVHRDRHGASAVSLSTWSLFAAANVATTCYALVVSNDTVTAALFACNAVGCTGIVVLTAIKRMSSNSGQRREPLVATEIRADAEEVFWGADLSKCAAENARPQPDASSSS